MLQITRAIIGQLRHLGWWAFQGSQDRHQLLLELLPDAVFIHADSKIVEANPSAATLFGHSSAAELLGKPVMDFVPKEDHEAFMNRARYIGNEPTSAFESRVLRSDGEIRAVESITAPTFYRGRPATLVVHRDVSEGRRLQDQLVQSQKMEAVGLLAGGIAHDFNNLLTAIGGYAAMSERAAPEGHPAREHLGEVREAVARAASLTAQLLTFARREISRPSTIDINELIQNTAVLLRRLIGEDIELVTRLSWEASVVRVDTQQIEQVLVNVAVNARDAMPDGGKLTITTASALIRADSTADLSPGQYVEVSIRDTGVGMVPEIKKHVFEPFFTTKALGRGSGLGLAACYGILKDNGGDIDVRSEPGRGTDFVLYLPAVDERPSTAGGEDVADRRPEGSERILLAEDEHSVRKLVAEILRFQGYHVIEATDGEDALRLAESHNDNDIQLLLTDVVMPGMGGVKLVEKFLKRWPATKVIFTSGYSEQLPVEVATGKKIPLLPKPFHPDELARLVRETLDAA